MNTIPDLHAPDPAGYVISGVERVAAYLTLLAWVGGVAGALAAWVWWRSLESAAISLGAGVGVGVLCLVVLYFHQQKQPVLHHLKTLEEKVQRKGSQVRELQGYLTEIHQHRQVMDSELRTQIETLKPAYKEKSADLNALFVGIDQREHDEIKAALEVYQEAFMRAAIADASIRRVRVPGFTTRVLERLEDAGILTAVDITTDRLKALPNLDPFLIQELDLWRQRIERDALARRPVQLPDERLEPIRMRYQEERMAVKASIEGLVYGMQSEVLKIENRIGKRLIQANANEDNLTERIGAIGSDYVELRERIRPLRQLTFWRYFATCLGIG